MTTFEITISDEKIQELLHGDRGIAALLEPTEEPDHAGRDDRPPWCRPRERTDPQPSTYSLWVGHITQAKISGVPDGAIRA